jgi:cellulase/cellobiase CelA1
MPRRSRRLRAPTSWVAVAGMVAATAAATIPLTATPAAAATACQVTYTVQNQWPTGFTTAVKLTNLGDAQTGWALTFAFPGTQRVDNGWSAV